MDSDLLLENVVSTAKVAQLFGRSEVIRVRDQLPLLRVAK